MAVARKYRSFLAARGTYDAEGRVDLLRTVQSTPTLRRGIGSIGLQRRQSKPGLCAFWGGVQADLGEASQGDFSIPLRAAASPSTTGGAAGIVQVASCFIT